MGRSRHDEQSLVVGIFPVSDFLIGLLTKIAAMCLLSVHDEYRCTDLVGCDPKILIQAHEGSRDVPSHVRIERAGVVATFLRLVIIHILLEIVGGVIRGCCGQSTLRLDLAGAELLRALCRQLLLQGKPSFFVHRVEIALLGDPGQVIQRDSHCRLDAGIQCGRVQRKTSPATDT